MSALVDTTFYAMFPEFASAPMYLVNQYIDLINNFYNLSDVSDSWVLNNYYYLLAHFVATSTMVSDKSQIAYPATSQTKSGENAGSLSADYASAYIANMTADQSFLTSTRYGQMFFFFQKKQYLNTVYGL